MFEFILRFFVLLSLIGPSEEGGEYCGSSDGCGATDTLHMIGPVNSVHLAVVACGDRGEETMVMLKSALLLSSYAITLHLFAEDQLKSFFIQNCDYFKMVYGERFHYKIYPITFPGVEDVGVWKELFKLCASQRLFIPDILQDIDSVIYVDTDILFLTPIENLWGFFEEFDGQQIAGLSPEHEEPQASWYPRFARHPFVFPYGVNSGVMLMNLTRIRRLDWLKELMAFQQEYRYNITWGDQDLLNIYFHKHPDQLFQFACAWNFRMDHCMYFSNCVSAESEGVSLLHGNRNAFHSDNFPSLRAIYEGIKEHDLARERLSDLKESIISRTKPHLSTNCGKTTDIITKKFFKYLVV